MGSSPGRPTRPQAPSDLLSLGIVVGLEQEALIAAPWGRVAIGGGGYDGAVRAAEVLVAGGASMLLSFGIAGGLDPALASGAVLAASEVWVNGRVIATSITPTGVRLARFVGATALVASVAEKAALRAATGAACVDMETGAVAEVAQRHGLPFGALRAICDPAQRALPPAAMDALQDGSIRFGRVVRALAKAPWQLPALLLLATDARRAQLALQSVRLTGLS